MSDVLPQFPYHPDPVATGSVVASAEVCQRCGKARGLRYVGPVYAVEEVEFLCPWCIADGSAADHFDADFTTADGAPSDVPAAVLDEIVRRTPGFAGWQQERWMFHCADGAEFLGRAGWDDVSALPGAVESLRLDEGLDDATMRDLSADGDLTAYLFRCRLCGLGLAYWDRS